MYYTISSKRSIVTQEVISECDSSSTRNKTNHRQTGSHETEQLLYSKGNFQPSVKEAQCMGKHICCLFIQE